MKKESFIVRKATELIAKKQSPAVLCGVAVAGLVITGIMAYRSGLKAHDILEEQKEKKEEMNKEAAPTKKEKIELVKETAKKIAPVVAPPLIMGGVTAACIIGGNRISNKRVAALSAAYAITRDALSKTNSKMVDFLGGGKAKQIKDEIVKDKKKKCPSNENTIVQATGKGNQLFKDIEFGTTFRSNLNAVDQAILELSADCVNEQYVTLDEFYDKLGLEHIGFGSMVGWSTKDLVGGKLPISTTSLIDDFYGEVVIHISYNSIGVSKRVYNFDGYY